MKKKTVVLTAAAVSLAILSAGCANENAEGEESAVYTEITLSQSVSVTESAEKPVTEADDGQDAAFLCSDITNEIIECVEMSSMAEVGADRIALYLDCAIPENCDFSMYICGSGGFADEVFVLNAGDNDISELISAVESRIESRMKDFESYNPDEFKKLEDYFSAEKNGYFIYTVTGDNDTCESIFEKYVK